MHFNIRKKNRFLLYFLGIKIPLLLVFFSRKDRSKTNIAIHDTNDKNTEIVNINLIHHQKYIINNNEIFPNNVLKYYVKRYEKSLFENKIDIHNIHAFMCPSTFIIFDHLCVRDLQ